MIPALSIFFLGLSGILLALYMLLQASNKKHTSRLIDVISFSLTGVGIVASLIAISSYERRLDEQSERMKVADDSLKAIERISDVLVRRCPNFDDLIKLFQAEQATARDCTVLYEYARGLVNVDLLRAVQLPATPLRQRFTDENALLALDEITGIVDEQRKTARAFIFSEARARFDRRDLAQLFAILAAASTFAMAFGMGLVRRVYDLRTAKKKSVKRR